MALHDDDFSNPQHLNITVNGQSLKEYLTEQVGDQAHDLYISVQVTIKKQLRVVSAVPTARTGTGSGRTRGNPGVKRGRQLTADELRVEAQKRGLQVCSHGRKVEL